MTLTKFSAHFSFQGRALGKISGCVTYHLAPLQEEVDKLKPELFLFALTKGKRSKRQLSKSFTVVIQPL